MSPCGASANANHWLGCFSVFTHGFYPNFFTDYYSPPVTFKVTFAPVSQGNLRPTFLLHYEIRIRKFFVVPACSSLQSGCVFRAGYEGAGTEPWKTTPGLQYLRWVCIPRGTLCTRIAAGMFCRCHCPGWLGWYFGNEGSGAAGAQLLAVTSAKQARSAISSSILASSPVCFRLLGPSGRTAWL